MALKKYVRIKLIVFITLSQMISSTVSEKQLVNSTSVSKRQINYSAVLRRVDDIMFKDIPVLSDLSDYLEVIKDFNSFSKNNLNDIDINYALGVMLVHVNLNAALRQKYEVPETELKDIEDLIKGTTELLEFFFTMVKIDNNTEDIRSKHMASLMSNPDDWVARIKPYSQSEQVNPMWRNSDLFISWSKYVEMMKNNPGAPSPVESDMCISSIVTNNNAVQWTSSGTKCTLDPSCYGMLLKGGNLGYALTHRLLLVMVARLARGCAIFSEEEDTELILHICSYIYFETEFIANSNSDDFIDLLAEQIALCSCAGFSQFLHRSWLNQIIKHQKDEGCFGLESAEHIITGETKKWVILKSMGNHGILNGKCNGHLTSVAAGSVAAGVRLIMALTDSTATN